MSRMFVFGLGYSARVLARRLLARGWVVAGTCRDESGLEELRAEGINAFTFARDDMLSPEGMGALYDSDHLLCSVPPDAAGDPVLDVHGPDIAQALSLRWAGYLSTTGVYGDTGGEEVDEEAPRQATSARGLRRVAAEDAWLKLLLDHGIPVHLFRLAGIYGPGRSVFDQIRDGKAHRIDRPGHLFGRIHVQDIACVLEASMARPNPGAAYNVTDDEPAAPADVTEYACRLLGIEPPPLEPYETAAATMSEMARTFWRDNRRVANERLHAELGLELAYPTFREGLRAVLAAGG